MDKKPFIVNFLLSLTIPLSYIIVSFDTGTYYDADTNLEWEDSFNNKVRLYEKEWYDAKAYCEELRLNNHSDWYLPSKDELINIYNKKYELKNIKKYYYSYYWSSTEER